LFTILTTNLDMIIFLLLFIYFLFVKVRHLVNGEISNCSNGTCFLPGLGFWCVHVLIYRPIYEM